MEGLTRGLTPPLSPTPKPAQTSIRALRTFARAPARVPLRRAAFLNAATRGPAKRSAAPARRRVMSVARPARVPFVASRAQRATWTARRACALSSAAPAQRAAWVVPAAGARQPALRRRRVSPRGAPTARVRATAPAELVDEHADALWVKNNADCSVIEMSINDLTALVSGAIS